MMWFFQKKVTKQQKDDELISQLQRTVKSLELQLKNVTSERDTLVGKFKQQTQCADVGVDMEMMGVFSIERRDDCTVIGYFPSIIKEADSTSWSAREWWFQCSMKTHDRLIGEFNTLISKRNAQNV